MEFKWNANFALFVCLFVYFWIRWNSTQSFSPLQNCFRESFKGKYVSVEYLYSTLIRKSEFVVWTSLFFFFFLKSLSFSFRALDLKPQHDRFLHRVYDLTLILMCRSHFINTGSPPPFKTRPAHWCGASRAGTCRFSSDHSPSRCVPVRPVILLNKVGYFRRRQSPLILFLTLSFETRNRVRTDERTSTNQELCDGAEFRARSTPLTNAARFISRLGGLSLISVHNHHS